MSRNADATLHVYPRHAWPPAPRLYGVKGQVRDTFACIVLFIVTLHGYALYWFYAVHDETTAEYGDGIGGLPALGLAALPAVVAPFVSGATTTLAVVTVPYLVLAALTSAQVGRLFRRRSEPKPVGAWTVAWVLVPDVVAGIWFGTGHTGLLGLVGVVIAWAGYAAWFVKTNGALNRYWLAGDGYGRDSRAEGDE